MPSFGGLFGKKKDSSAPSSSSKGPSQKGPVDVNTRLQKMHDASETLELRERVLLKRINDELAAARAAQQKGNKTVALRHLKQKKAYEEQMARLGGQMLNMQSMRDKLEETATATHTFEAMQGGATDLSRLNKNMNADKIADVMDQVQEANDMANEALDALAQPIGGAMVDDDDLLAELDELDQADLDEQMMGLASPAGKAPATAAAKPGAKVAPVSAQDEDDLEELERMMNA